MSALPSAQNASAAHKATGSMSYNKVRLFAAGSLALAMSEALGILHAHLHPAAPCLPAPNGGVIDLQAAFLSKALRHPEATGSIEGTSAPR